MRVETLARYPVKGLGPQLLDHVTLTPGDAIPFDRLYAIENGKGRFDPENPKWLPKVNFLMLMRHERLALLETQFEEEGHTLTLLRDGKQVARGSLATKLGRQMIEQFMAAYMAAELKGAPKVLFCEGHRFTDIAAKALHIVNLETVRDLGRMMGQDLDPIRFRANIYVDGVPAWAERKWVGQTMRLGDGGAALKVFDETGRCEATSVDPKTGVRGLSVPAFMERTLGHTELGVYAKVVAGGTVATGQPLTLQT